MIDLEKLYRIFSRRGERVVLLLPDTEPMVLVPLSEYEHNNTDLATVAKSPSKNSGHHHSTPASSTANQQTLQGRKVVNSENKANLSQKITEPEQIDPLAGPIEDDDQYFPEPL